MTLHFNSCVIVFCSFSAFGSEMDDLRVRDESSLNSKFFQSVLQFHFFAEKEYMFIKFLSIVKVLLKHKKIGTGNDIN